MIVEIISIGLALVVIFITLLAFIITFEDQKKANKMLEDTLKEGKKFYSISAISLESKKILEKDNAIFVYGIRIPSKYKSFREFMNTRFKKNSIEHRLKLSIKATEKWLDPKYATKVKKSHKNAPRNRKGQFKKIKK